jgi:AraC-like DNA-binding protein
MASPTRTNSLAPGIAPLAKAEGRNRTRYDGASVFRVSGPETPTPTLYSAAVFLVGAGEKRGFLGDQTFVYDAHNYLVVLSPMPMLCQTFASATDPLLSLALDIELEVLRGLIADVDPDTYGENATPPLGAFGGRLTPEIEEAAARLLAALAEDSSARVLARQTVREIFFHMLRGPDGNALRNLAHAHGPTSQITRVLRFIADHYAERLPVEDLAKLAHMSVPTFHQHFKAMTSTSPLQYVKAMRLTRARQLLQGGSTAKGAAQEVGYESLSQFSREFRRFFDFTPSQVAHVPGSEASPSLSARPSL